MIRKIKRGKLLQKLSPFKKNGDKFISKVLL